MKGVDNMDLIQIALELKYKSMHMDCYNTTSRINVVTLNLGNEIWLPKDINTILFEHDSIIAVGVSKGCIIVKDAWYAINYDAEIEYQFLTLHITDDFTIYLPMQFRKMDCENEAHVQMDVKKRQIVITE